MTDRRVVVLNPLVLAPPWIHGPAVVECDLASIPEPSYRPLPLQVGYGNVYFGTPNGWARRPSAVPFAYLPVERLEFLAIPDPGAVARLIGGLRQTRIADSLPR